MRLGGVLGISEPALLEALTHGSAGQPRAGQYRRAGSAAAFIDAVGDFIGKDVAVVRETVAELGGDLGALDGMVDAGAAAMRHIRANVSFSLMKTPLPIGLQLNSHS